MNDWQDTWTRLKAHPRERVKLLLGRTFYPQATLKWVGFVRAHPVLLLQVARQLANAFGCTRVLLVSNRQRVALNPVRRMKIKLDLEGLWRDLGADPQADGFFVVSPQVVIPQDFSDVASNKRAEARRKAALAGALLDGVSASVARLSASPAH